ncbi:MAG: acyltransferase [Gemmataceae bacterium]|nr:acyltransferase [Gemmataceae bacterium]
MKPPGGPMRYTNIQFLRAAAAGGVVLHHLGCHAPALVGVDPAGLRHVLLAGFPVPLFFAVSGFVLTGALQSAPPGRFLVARFLRLYPGYWLAVLGAVVLMRLRAFTEYDRWLIRFVDATELALWPAGPGRCPYVLGGVEWSLIYEVFLSAALAGLALVGGRRGLPWLAGGWLAVLVGKMILWPGYAFDMFPHWTTIALSPHSVPFLLGVLAYQVRDRGRRLWWAVLPAVAGLLLVAPARVADPEWHWCNWGLAAAGVVWLAAQFRQVGPDNRLARAGDWTYGLYLIHNPLVLAVLYAAARLGWAGRWEPVWLAGLVGLAGGLLFGRLEAAVHARLRPLVKADVGGWARGLARRVVRLTSPSGRSR